MSYIDSRRPDDTSVGPVLGPLHDVSRAEYPTFRIAFGVLDRIIAAESVRIDLGGNEVTLPAHRRELIARFVETVRGGF